MNISLRAALIAASALNITLVTNACAQNAVVSEYSLKAAYLYHFVQFTEWPEAVLRGTDTFTICIAEDNPLRPMLSDLAGRPAHGKPIAIREHAPADEGRCQVIVFGVKELQSAQPANLATRAPALTIAEEGAETEPVIIALSTEERRVGFVIDKTLAEACGLTISSKLLRLARSVR